VASARPKLEQVSSSRASLERVSSARPKLELVSSVGPVLGQVSAKGPRLSFLSSGRPIFDYSVTAAPVSNVVAGVAGLMQFRAFNAPASYTGYMTSAGIDTDLIDANEPVPAGTAGLLTVGVNAAPGAGETFTYTVMKNGVATALTVAISGASATKANVATDVAFAQDDDLSVKIVTSSGAAVTKHKATLKYTPA